MKNVIVCDDNDIVTKVIVQILEQYGQLYSINVTGFNTGKELLEYCVDNNADVIYMDIEVGEDNGMTLAKTIKNMNPNAIIIYISAYDNYYVDMVNAEPFRFIHKDLSDVEKFQADLLSSLEAAIRRLSGNGAFLFTFGRKQFTVDLDKVKYFHSVARIIHIVGDVDGQDFFYGKLNDVEKVLESESYSFVRISQSYIIDIKYARMKGKSKVTIDGKIFNITQKYIESFKIRYKDYWGLGD